MRLQGQLRIRRLAALAMTFFVLFASLPFSALAPWTSPDTVYDVENINSDNNASSWSNSANQIFWDDAGDRWYILYAQDIGTDDFVIRYSYSDSGDITTWNNGGNVNGEKIRDSSWAYNPPGFYFAWIYDQTNDLGHLVYYRDASTGTAGVYYVNFTIAGGGSLTFGSVRTIINMPAGNTYGTMDIALSQTNNYPIIAFGGYYGGVYHSWGALADSTDGYGATYNVIEYRPYWTTPISVFPTGTDSCILVNSDAYANNPLRYFAIDFDAPTSNSTGTGTSFSDNSLYAHSLATWQGITYNSTHGFVHYGASDYDAYAFIFDFATVTKTDEYQTSDGGTVNLFACWTGGSVHDNEFFSSLERRAVTNRDVYGNEYHNPSYDSYFNYTAENYILEDYIAAGFSGYSGSPVNTARTTDDDDRALLMVENGDYVAVTYWTLEGEFPTVDAGAPTFEDITLTNPETASMSGISTSELWCFAEWQYYDFEAMVSHTNATGGDCDDYIYEVAIGWTDGWNSFDAIYFAQNDTMTLYSDNPTVYSLNKGTVETFDEFLNVTFSVLFYGASIDARDIDITGFTNDTLGVADGPETIKTDYFNLYVYGGDYLVTLVSGTGGQLPGGSWSELYASENSTVSSTVYYRNLQHFRLLQSIYAANVTGSTFELQYYIDVCTEEDGWYSVCAMILEANSGATGSDRYIQFDVDFYQSGTLDADASDSVYWFHRANVGAGSGDPTQTEVWIDGWIDRENQSTYCGIRNNAYYYPMEDSSDVWFRWLSTNWGVNDDLKKDDAYRCQMYDIDATDPTYSKEIIMVRITFVLAVAYGDGGSQDIEVSNYQTADYSFAPLSEEFVAIETPPAMETLIPAMPQGGWFGALLGAFRWLADVLIPGLGGLSIWNQMVDFLDSIAAAFGAPNLFSNLITWFLSFWDWLTTSLGYLLLGLAEVFTFFAVFMGTVLETFVDVMGAWIDMARAVVDVMGGALQTGVNMWTDFNISQFIILAAILYPMWLFFMWDEEGIDPVIRHLEFVKGILEFLFNFFVTIAQFGINLIGRVIESIPIVE